MSFERMPSGATAQQPRPQAVPAGGEARTLTLRLRSPAAAPQVEVAEGSLVVPVTHPAMPHTLHAGVVRAEAAPLTLTFHRD